MKIYTTTETCRIQHVVEGGDARLESESSEDGICRDYTLAYEGTRDEIIAQAYLDALSKHSSWGDSVARRVLNHLGFSAPSEPGKPLTDDEVDLLRKDAHAISEGFSLSGIGLAESLIATREWVQYGGYLLDVGDGLLSVFDTSECRDEEHRVRLAAMENPHEGSAWHDHLAEIPREDAITEVDSGLRPILIRWLEVIEHQALARD